MIFFVYESKLCMATLVFYTCIYLPLLQMKRAILSILGFILCTLHQPFLECSNVIVESRENCSSSMIDLPMSRYGDLKNCKNNVNGDDDDTEACSVCLAEFESEDMVSQLSKCGHVFHMECIDKWVERSQFTCPLCRSSLLNVHGSCHATCNTSMLSCISR